MTTECRIRKQTKKKKALQLILLLPQIELKEEGLSLITVYYSAVFLLLKME